ncbi:MAG: hypothetical protein CMP16_03445 [Rickettsiales bacterium]|nr:hypothetical protein [Rickettsiales bacterium]
MKNIFWISSYPKSGNTMVRLFMSCYFFTNDGILKDLNIIKNITIFNNINIFKKIKNFEEIDEFKKNPSNISKYWINAQERLYEIYPKKVFFFKTHNSNIEFKGNKFTNNKLTRGFIYIVRDPRSVLVSAKNHYNYKSYDEGFNYLNSERHLSLAKYHVLPEFLLSWKSNYLSWKKFLEKNPNLGLIIKFEDLVSNPEKNFLKIMNFIREKHYFNFDNKKFLNSLKSIKLNNLIKFEENSGFDERGSENTNFFRKGLKDEWKEEVPKIILNKIEKTYNKEMKELGYL